jgi:glycerol-3-phosphate acyltransferase PlsY
MHIAADLLWLLIAYLIGSIPTAYLIGKQIRGIDIREHGSGNVGATNAFRVLGKGWGTLVLVIDILKGWAVTAILAPTSGTFPELSFSLRQIFFAAAAILGHTWSPWLKLKGGKGIAVSAGALLGIFPLATVIGTLVWAVTFAVWRYVSLASIVAAACYPFLLLLFHRQLESFAPIFVISSVLAGLLIYNHRANIERIKRGDEPRVPLGKTPNP